MALSLSRDCNVVLAFKAVTVRLLYKRGVNFEDIHYGPQIGFLFDKLNPPVKREICHMGMWRVALEIIPSIQRVIFFILLTEVRQYW